MNKITSIKEKKINDIIYIGIVLAKDWFQSGYYGYPIISSDFVVCQWCDFVDGEKSNIEGLETIAICRKIEDAELIYNSKISKEESDDFCYVIYDTVKKTFLTKDEFFTTYLGNARVFSNKYDAESFLLYYIKIYKLTDRKDTTLNLEIHPVRMKIINT